MNELNVKNVDVFGSSIMAAQGKDGQIYAGVSYFCNALGMSKGQKDRQVKNVQKDKVLKNGCVKFDAGILDASNESVALRIDFIPLWLAKITVTDAMEGEHPELAEKLLNYQLKAKDVLSDAFVSSSMKKIDQSSVEIPAGEVASYLKIMDRVAVRQNLAPYKIAENFKKVSEQFGIQLTADFVKVPEYEQMTLDVATQ